MNQDPILYSFFLDCAYKFTRGDWGEVDEHDKEQNDLSLETGLRMIGVYKMPKGIIGKGYYGTEEKNVWVMGTKNEPPMILYPSEY